jgi:predicted RNase H-like HicB family nuclease
MKLTAFIKKCDKGYYCGIIKNFPGAISQGKTKPTLVANLKDAFALLYDFKDKTKIKITPKLKDDIF